MILATNQTAIESILQLASYKRRESQSVTVILGYIDHCITSKNIMLVTFHYAIIMINTLTHSK